MKNTNSRKDKKGRKLLTGERQKPDGRYEYRYTDLDGKIRSVYSWRLTDTDPVTGDMSDITPLRVKENEITAKLSDGIQVYDNAHVTLGDLYRKYMASLNVGEDRRQYCESIYKIHIKEYFGNTPVSKISVSDIQGFAKHLRKEIGLKPSTIMNYISILRSIIQVGVLDDILTKNVVSLTKVTFTKEETYEKKKYLSEEEVEELLCFARNSKVYNRYYPLLVFFIETGMRCGEVFALTWNDIDFANKEIIVNKTLKYVPRNGKYTYVMNSPKTRSSIRKIPMTSNVFAVLKAMRDEQFQHGRFSSTVQTYSGFCFFLQSGMPYNERTLLAHLDYIVQAHNNKNEGIPLPHITPHMFRHTFATLARKNNIDAKTVSSILGHSNLATTLNVYTDVTEEMKKNAMDEVSAKSVISIA